MDRRRFTVGILNMGLLAAPDLILGARPARAESGFWAALSGPGATALMRHALAPGTGDPAEFTLGDCSTQRNLDKRGREQARATGRKMRAQGVRFDRVLTSQWCRCRETAELLDVGPVEDLPAINSFFGDRSQGPRQTAETRAFLARLPAEARVMLVTHFVNIRALSGSAASSGEVVAVSRAEAATGAAPGQALPVLGSARLG